MNMQRYQLYLNPQSVGMIDEMAKTIDIPRARIFQDFADGVASLYAQVAHSITQRVSRKKTAFDEFVGMVNLKTKEKTNFALKKDREYFYD